MVLRSRRMKGVFVVMICLSLSGGKNIAFAQLTESNFQTHPGTDGTGQGQEARSNPADKEVKEAQNGVGWRQADGVWNYLDEDGGLYKGWLLDGNRYYYLDMDGAMATGWREVDGEWYYFHEDGGMNQGALTLGNGKYEFTEQGALAGARWVENTGGGPYAAGCYDETAQALFDQLNEKKRDIYFDEHPEREQDYDGDIHREYDRYAGFAMDMSLNKAAARRLASAMSKGYQDGRIPGEGDLKEYMSASEGKMNATCLELYIRECEDQDEAFQKALSRTQDRYESRGDRKDSLEYYRTLGMAHVEKGQKHYFMIILTR